MLDMPSADRREIDLETLDWVRLGAAVVDAAECLARETLRATAERGPVAAPASAEEARP